MRASGFTIGGLLGLTRYRNVKERGGSWIKAGYWLDKGRPDPTVPMSMRRPTLPYGDQRRLEIARAMCTEPEAPLSG